MKKNLKSILWFGASAISFILLIIAMFAVGFKYGGTIGSLITVPKLDKMKASDSGYGWMVSGLVISGIAVLLSAMKLIFSIQGNKNSNNKIWSFLLFGLIIAAGILVMIGSSVKIDSMNNNFTNSIKVDGGMAFLLFLLIFIAMGIAFVPVLFGNQKKKTKSNKNKNANLKTK